MRLFYLSGSNAKFDGYFIFLQIKENTEWFEIVPKTRLDTVCFFYFIIENKSSCGDSFYIILSRNDVVALAPFSDMFSLSMFKVLFDIKVFLFIKRVTNKHFLVSYGIIYIRLIVV